MAMMMENPSFFKDASAVVEKRTDMFHLNETTLLFIGVTLGLACVLYIIHWILKRFG